MRALIYILLLIFTGCRTVYVPFTSNTPMFTKAGELQLSAGVTTGDYAGHYEKRRALDVEFQSAFSISKHLGLIGNYAFTNHLFKYQHHRFGEVGIGYFSNEGTGCFEIFSGFGRGFAISPFRDTYDGRGGTETRYNRFFIQPAYGWNKKAHHVSIIGRLSFVRFSHFGEYGRPLSLFFFEPAVSGRLNVLEDQLFFQWQAGLSLDSSHEYPGMTMQQVGVSASIGLGARILTRRDEDQ